MGLSVLRLLSEAAQSRPLVCVIDDAQWLDRASAQALAFVARRMLAEPAEERSRAPSFEEMLRTCVLTVLMET
jgi:hypothetical protein